MAWVKQIREKRRGKMGGNGVDWGEWKGTIREREVRVLCSCHLNSYLLSVIVMPIARNIFLTNTFSSLVQSAQLRSNT